MLGQRYQLLDPLGTGGMGTVYRALDRLTGQVVALKQITAPEYQPEGDDENSVRLRLSLAQEFRLLASLHHPHVIRVLDYGFDERRQPFYTMELLENAPTILEAGRGKGQAEQVRLLIELLQALTYLHRWKIVHCDLKPSNVLVYNGRVKVLDFGLSIVHGQTPDSGSTTAGTLAYMAPEVLTGQAPMASSDLYAVGTIAYEMLVGEHPFSRDDVGSLIRQVLTRMPEIRAPHISPEVAYVLQRLLAKSPVERFEDANEAIIAFADAARQSIPPETKEIRESFLQNAPMVGREVELKGFTDALADIQSGRGSTWLIGGESGVGKSRFVDEIRIRAVVQGALVLRGQAIHQGASPFHLWRPIVRWLSLFTRVSESEAAALRGLIPDIEILLGMTLPPNSEGQAKGSALPQVVQDMFRRVQHPIVLILEDLQWIGSESLHLLTRINALTNEQPLLIVGSFRDDERPDLPELLPQMRPLRLNRLSMDGITQLSEAILGDAGQRPAVLDLLQRETEGNVFFLIEVVRALAEEAGTLEQIGMVTLPQNVFAGGIKRIVSRRLNRVPPWARGLLQLAAVAGREVDLRLLAAINPMQDLDDWLTACVEAAVLEIHNGQWRFSHDKLREGLLDEMTADRRRDHHHRVALALEALHPDVAEQMAALAYHWGMAEDAVQELHYTTKAGEFALRSGAYREAARLLRRALHLLQTQESAQRPPRSEPFGKLHVQAQLAEAYLAMGDYGEAQTLLLNNLETLRTLTAPKQTAETLARLGDIAYAQEAYPTAETYYDESLRLFRQLADAFGTARVLSSLGDVAYDLDDHERAQRLYQESLAISRETRAGWGMAGSIREKDALAGE